jgi:hypothetical protein
MGMESGDANVADEDMTLVFCHARFSACTLIATVN